jgi:hypothetical protein
MNCRRVEPLLSKHLEGLLPARESQAVASHLEDCWACLRLRNELQELTAELRKLPRLPLSPDTPGHVAERWIAEREAKSPQWQRGFLALSPPTPSRWPPLGAAALVLLVLSVGLAWWGHERGKKPSRFQVVQQPLHERIVPAPSALPPRVNQTERRIARGPSAPPGASYPSQPSLVPPHPRSDVEREQGPRTPTLDPRPARPVGGDLTHLDGRPAQNPEGRFLMPPDAWEAVERRVRLAVPVRDDFVQVPFPQLASTADGQIAEAVGNYKREAAIVDPRLAREVTLQQKATALSDLCEKLSAETGIQLAAGSSVADEKVTLFCEKLPLRDVMRQLSRPFGYAWSRSSKQGEYRYELMQDLRSQLLEEELRNRDRSEALLALQKEVDRFRPFLQLSPDEALARAKTAAPRDKQLLEHLAYTGWGPIQIYFRLTPQQMTALRAGGGLAFSADPYPDQERLPPDVAAGVLQGLREYRAIKTENGVRISTDVEDPKALPLTAVPEIHAQIRLYLRQSELGQFTLSGQAGYLGPNRSPDLVTYHGDWDLAAGRSPAALQPNNAATNAKLASDPALRPRVSVQPEGRYPATVARLDPAGQATANGGAQATERKVTSADVLEALHRATGMPIIADFYTRLYKVETVSLRNQSLFDALNHLADAMRLHWHKESGPAAEPTRRVPSEGGWGTRPWLQFRSASYYHDRLKEVPNRLLRRWQAARREQGILTLDDLVEIAGLPDAPLDAREMAEGAKEIWGMAEWDLASSGNLRPQLHYLASFTPTQRQEALSPAGLAFTKMTLAQQQQFIANAIYGRAAPLQSLDELAGAVLRVDYTQPGWFEWPAPEDFRRWAMTIEPGPEGRREPHAPIRERTREAARQALREVQSRMREIFLKFAPKQQVPIEEAEKVLQKMEVSPTQLYLAIVYIPGTSNRRPIHMFDNRGNALYNG